MTKPKAKVLKDFPLIYEAVRNIYLDSRGGLRLEITVDRWAEIPAKWELCFRAVENCFADIEKKYERIFSLGWRLKTEDWWAEIHVTPASRTLYWVWLPVNDSDKDILYACGCSDAQVYCVKRLLEEYFDGELRDVLEKKK